MDCYFLFYIVTFAMLKLMHSKIVIEHKLWLFPLPILALFVTYCTAYVVCIGPKLSVHGYKSFIAMRVSKICYVILSVIIVVEVLLGAIELVRGVRYYKREVGNYFSGAQETIGARVSRVIWFLLIYIVIAVTDFLVSSRTVDLICTFANMFVYLGMSLVILNMHNTYAIMSSAFREEESGDSLQGQDTTQDRYAAVSATSSSDTSEDDGTDGGNDTLASDGDDPSADAHRYIEEIVHIWSNRDDKPFLKEGLTIAETAGQMGISPRLLSGYLNDIFEMNFNSWINMLRVNEVKRLIRDGSNATMADLSELSGFTDSSAMSKIFKRQEGVTPTQYRNEVRKSAVK